MRSENSENRTIIDLITPRNSDNSAQLDQKSSECQPGVKIGRQKPIKISELFGPKDPLFSVKLTKKLPPPRPENRKW